jgi:hypothetical protein
MAMETKKPEWKGFGPDPRDPSTVLYVQADDIVTPIRPVGPHAELGDPIKASDLWKEKK